ncbi:MAG TPA: thiamine pyrophosphate-binding protein [Pirellulales bacterium]|nr:thiamine pyrophosphate-binding protein [Pirellulales bacterium]
MAKSGAQALLDMLADSGVRYLFGNPGTTELPLVDALSTDHRIQYVLGLQEVPVVATADGYAQASRKLGVINLHISCGLGNGMGMLYNAYRAGTPLLVTAGQQDRRLKFEEPILWSDMVSVARPWTKWAAEIERVADLPTAVRRAIQTALTPPTGPVFLSLPIDLQMEMAELDLTPGPPLDARVRPPVEALRRAAKLLAEAKNPAILSGSRVVEADAVAQVVSLADRLGAPVFTESGTTHGRLGFPADHDLYGQALPLWAPEVRDRLAEFDVILVVGMDLLRLYVYFEPARAIPEHVRLIHLDQDAWQIGKNYPTEVGLISDPQAGLTELENLLAATMTGEAAQAAARRGHARRAARRARRQELRERAEKEAGQRPLTPLGFMSALARILPDDVAVIEEAVTTTNTYFERLGVLRNTTGYFAHRGWALGWGLGCALGVKLAWPQRPVLALLGEGAAMYGIQGLWTAARYRIPVTFVVPNNAQYQILKVGAKQLQLPTALRDEMQGCDLNQPEIDLVGLARSLGVEAHRITEPDELADRVAESLAGDTPRLFDVPIQRTAPGTLSY